MQRRVVVTGLGMVTSLGLSVASTWESVLAGRSGISPLPADVFSEFPAQIGGRLHDFPTEQFLTSKEARKMDTFMVYGLAAASEAIADAGYELGRDYAPERAGVALGAGIGGLPLLERSHNTLVQKGPKRFSPMFIPGVIINLLPGHASIRHGLKGPNVSVVTACATGAHNIGLAARAIAYGDADLMVAGGAEMASSPMAMAGFASMRALSTRNDEPEKASRPWDKDRDGFVLSDGSGVLVLEAYDTAKARGAHIYAELSGFGWSADAYHMTLPDPDGPIRALNMALQDAGCSASDVDYVNAHATSTPAGDKQEVLALKTVLGDRAHSIPVSSTKSMTGHLLGAAGSVEAIFSILAIRDQVAPPTINLDNPDEGCDLNFVPHTPQEHAIHCSISNSFGFGGTNASLLFRDLDDA